MKIGRLVINILKLNTIKSTNKRRKLYPPYGKYEERIDIPYIDDGHYNHKFDVIYGAGEKKKCCIIDIHGGSYIVGGHIDQYAFGDYFLRLGYDFVSLDYISNDGDRSIKDMFDDLYHNLTYLFSHLKELKLDEDDFIITGDSAGGHMALTLAQALTHKEYANKLGYKFPDVPLKGCMVNCPVYDFVHLGDNNLTKSGMKRLFGPRYNDKDLFVLLSPKENKELLTFPLFVSTCKKDFLRGEALKIKSDVEGINPLFRFKDIDSDTAGHVHNVLHPFRPEGDEVNKAMVEFIEECQK